MALKTYGAAALLLATIGPALAETPAAAPADQSITYIFSGSLGTGEAYSGTLVAVPDGPQFELKLGKGAVCDAGKLEPDKGLLRLEETACSDGRKLKALFVYQQGGYLRVYGSVGDERFGTLAHALPNDAPDAAKPSAAPPKNLMGRPGAPAKP
jgi:hypothetical protein